MSKPSKPSTSTPSTPAIDPLDALRDIGETPMTADAPRSRAGEDLSDATVRVEFRSHVGRKSVRTGGNVAMGVEPKLLPRDCYQAVYAVPGVAGSERNCQVWLPHGAPRVALNQIFDLVVVVGRSVPRRDRNGRELASRTLWLDQVSAVTRVAAA